MDIRAVRAVWLAIGVAVASAVVPVASGSPETSPRDTLVVTRAKTIQLQVSSRYRRSRGTGFEVTEASSTGVVESFTLLSAHLTETRIVPADNGVYYAVCPVRAKCPYSARRFAHSAAAFLPRRIALELAVRTFQETSADVVAVSLPTARFVLFIIERTEFDQDDLSTLGARLARNPRLSTPVVRQLIDRATRPRVYAVIGLEPTPSGRDTLGAVPVWPGAGTVLNRFSTPPPPRLDRLPRACPRNAGTKRSAHDQEATARVRERQPRAWPQSPAPRARPVNES